MKFGPIPSIGNDKSQGKCEMNRKILVIEDDRDALSNLCDILGLDGHEVVGAETFREASERGDWSSFSAILLDRKLPDGTADDFLPRIRAAAPHTAVIVITGSADLQGTIAALRGGAADYLLKPVNADVLRATIERALRLREIESKLLQSERLAAIGQMMTVLTHESGNILARGNAILEMLELEVENVPSALELIERLKKASGDLRRLHEEVRNYAAPIELDRDRWDLASIWRQTWKNLANTHKSEHPPSLVENVAEVDLKCDVDAFRLDQVFRNLFENAVAACRHAARIEVECRDCELQDRPAIQVTVRDNGPGLTPDQAKRAFAPFYTTKPKGTGLGLAIVSRIVEAHGGTILLESIPNDGAAFVITLPRRVSERMNGGRLESQAPEIPSVVVG
jgi:signal transduction histidine kinase